MIFIQDNMEKDSYHLEVRELHNGLREDSLRKIKPAPGVYGSPDVSISGSHKSEKPYERFHFSLCSFHTISSGMYGTPPLWSIAAFQSVVAEKEFRLFKCLDVNVALAVFQVALAFIYLALRFCINYVFIPDRLNPVFVVAFAANLTSIFLSLQITFDRLASSSFLYGIRSLQPYAESSVKRMETVLGKVRDDVAVLSAVSAGSLLMLARILAGPCPADISTWELQTCNPGADNGQLPSEQLLAACVLVLMFQVFIKGCSRSALMLSWTIILVLTNTCLALVEADVFYWITVNIPMIGTFALSYEIERLTVCRFVQEKTSQVALNKLFRLELALANEKIKEGRRDLESKRSMVRHISHEIRTPLNIASIGVEVLEHELLRLGDALPRSSLELVAGIKAASSAALVIVNELLAFEKLAAGMFVLELAPTGVVQFVSDTLKEFSILCQAKDITLAFSPSLPESFGVQIDPVKMAYVLRNFLSNAVKFTPNKGRIIVSVMKSMSVSMSGKLNCVVISVEDNGAGLSAENVTNLFQEGVQFNANTLQNGGGSGFGLFIAKGISDLHKGCSIWATSPGEGKGCSFNLELPLFDMPELSLHRRSFDNIRTSSMNFPNIDSNLNDSLALNVLVVDDSAASRRMVVRLLKLAGHNCTEADDGLSAVREISLMLIQREEGDKMHTQYDAVLMDSSMPKMNGPEAAISMRGLGFMGAIIGISGHDDPSEFNKAGADLVMIKPVDMTQLTCGLNSVIFKRKNMEPREKGGRKDSGVMLRRTILDLLQ